MANQPINQLTDKLINYTLHLADNALVIAQRNSEWCGHGPVLEQDIALTNIALDLIGQARNFYQYAAKLISAETDEDKLAFLRDNREYKNCLLTEQLNGDWAKTTLRQFFFSTYQLYLYEKLQRSNDEQIAAIAAKAIKEVTYHLRWSSEWVIRLGDGTSESSSRMNNAISDLWPYTGEMFIPADYELAMAESGAGIDPSTIKESWMKKVADVFNEAGLIIPSAGFMHTGGKQGKHTEHLDHLLTEMQYMQRAYPDSKW